MYKLAEAFSVFMETLVWVLELQQLDKPKVAIAKVKNKFFAFIVFRELNYTISNNSISKINVSFGPIACPAP